MSATELLVVRMQAMLMQLKAGDALGPAGDIEALVEMVAKTPDAWGDARVHALHRECAAEAQKLMGQANRELTAQATGARAASAYGEAP